MWFAEKKIAVSEAPPMDPRGALEAELTAIDSQLAVLNRAALQLRREFKLRVDRFGRVTGMEASLAASADVQTTWRTLQKRGGALLQRRNKVLAEWSALKMASDHPPDPVGEFLEKQAVQNWSAKCQQT
jgi:hypothetical protein